MTQVYKDMNSVGKYYFWTGAILQVSGLLGVLLGGLETRIPVLGACALAMGSHFILLSTFDTRCNIKNDTKGNPLPTSTTE